MELPVNIFKRALKAGNRQIGLWCSLSNHYAIEVVAGAGFDWLLLDTEHSPNELTMVLSQLQACAAYPVHPVVRVPWNDMVMIKRFLDIGAQSLLIPYIQNEEEARIDDAIRRIRKAGRAPGILTLVEADAKHWLEIGCQFLAVGADTNILARESENLAKTFKIAVLGQTT